MKDPRIIENFEKSVDTILFNDKGNRKAILYYKVGSSRRKRKAMWKYVIFFFDWCKDVKELESREWTGFTVVTLANDRFSGAKVQNGDRWSFEKGCLYAYIKVKKVTYTTPAITKRTYSPKYQYTTSADNKSITYDALMKDFRNQMYQSPLSTMSAQT